MATRSQSIHRRQHLSPYRGRVLMEYARGDASLSHIWFEVNIRIYDQLAYSVFVDAGELI